MFDGSKKKAKMFFQMGNGELRELPELSSLEVNQTAIPEGAEYIRPPSEEEISLTVDLPPGTVETMRKALHLDCFGIFPHRKDGCGHCNMANDCIKAKIANNFNRR